jgi:hypothetical protein
MGLRRTAVAAVTVLALGGLTAGCGGSGTKDDARGTAATGDTTSTGTSPGSSPSSTPTASTGADAGGSTSAGGLDKDSFAAALSSAIKKHKTAHVTMSFAGTLTAEGDVSYAADDPAMRLTMQMGAMSRGKMEMRFVDGTMYMQVPGMTPDGKFLQIGKDDATFGPMLKQLQNFGPDGAVAMMGKGVKSFRHVGSSTIDGKSYAHYQVTVDPRAVASDLNLPSDGASDLPKNVTEDLYVDSDNLMRRVTMEVQGHKVVVDATDWGKPVHVTAPPKSQIMKMPAGAGMSG